MSPPNADDLAAEVSIVEGAAVLIRTLPPLRGHRVNDPIDQRHRLPAGLAVELERLQARFGHWQNSRAAEYRTGHPTKTISVRPESQLTPAPCLRKPFPLGLSERLLAVRRSGACLPRL